MNKALRKDNSDASLNEKQKILSELEFMKKEIQRYEDLINMMECEDLIEAYIYEYKAVELRYNHLIKLARSKNINIEYIERHS